jgi:hypothetical protein
MRWPTFLFAMMSTVVPGRINVLKDLKQTNQIVGFGTNRRLIRLKTTPVRIYLARDYSICLGGPDAWPDVQWDLSTAQFPYLALQVQRFEPLW